MEESLLGVGAVAARLFAERPYLDVRLEDLAGAVMIPRAARGRRPRQAARGRSLMWLYGLIQSKGQAVALGAAVAWAENPAGRRAGVPGAGPETLQQSRSAVSAAIACAAGFIRDERFLFRQLAAGLSDLPQRRNAVHRDWPDSPLGRVVSGARDGRCVIFADWLVPVLAAACAPVAAADEVSARPAAVELSDLVFRVSLADPAARPQAVADGLAAYWFERYLLAPAGSPGAAAVRDLDHAERAAGALPPGSPVSRAASAARARAALATGRAHRRAVAEYESVTAAFVQAGEWDQACDAAARLSLALHRWGDMSAAARSAALSRQLAAEHLGPDDQRIPRADTMAANAAVAAGWPAQGLALADSALTVRASAHDRENSGSSWRRLSLSQESHALALAAAGQITQAVSEAAALAADREMRLPTVGDVPAPVLEARRVLGCALLERGSLGQARDLLAQVLADRQARGERYHANTARATADLARCLLLLGSAGEALALLAEAPGSTDWFASRVSFRLACSIWRYQAEALLSHASATGGRVDHAAVAALLAHCEERLDSHGVGELDTLRLAICRSKARAWWAAGDTAAAIAILAGAVTRQAAAAERDHPRLLAARCELGSYLAQRGADGGLAEAERQFSQVTAVSEGTVAGTHPCRLAARLGLAYLTAPETSPPRDVFLLLPAAGGRRPPLDPRHPVMRAATQLAAAHRPGNDGAQLGDPGDGDRNDWDE